MRKLVGIDINGWHDYACRDWTVDDPDDRPNAPVVVDGGFGSVVVSHKDTWIGGPQATLSPIGRGGGWSEVGATDKRHDLIQSWRAFLAGQPPADFRRNIRAAIEALSVQGDGVVLSMPDRLEMSEARQQDLLIAASGRRARVTLLWRSVALALDLIGGSQAAKLADGCVVVCVLHSHDGFEVQRFILRQLVERPDSLAPERAEVGTVVCPDLGLGVLEAHARTSVEAANRHLKEWTTETPRLPFHLLFEEPVAITEEIVRRSDMTGSWTAVRAPTSYSVPISQIDLGSAASAADLIVFSTPLAERHRQRFVDALSAKVGKERLHVAEPASAARGALIAGRRIERGIPHYLDRLDQISLAVSRRTGPTFEDLIPPNATVPGNREYVSAPITSMVWPAGMKHAHFYIATFERPRPVVPQRVRYRPHIGLWDGSLRIPGVATALRGMNLRIPDTLRRLADAVSASYRLDGLTVVYAVGTDGDFPDELDEPTRSRFLSIIHRLSEDLLRTIKRRYAVENNHALRCLTWVFALCPDDVKEELVRALISIQTNQNPPHPFLTVQGSRRVVVHGLGRAATDPDMLRNIIPRLYEDLDRPNILAALSSVLARPEASPTVLTDNDVTRIARRITGILGDQRNQRKFGVSFKYALMVVAGLLRVRERDPWALIASESADARALVEVLQDILVAIRNMPGAIPNEAEKLRITQELISLLSGEGGRPDILTMMDGLAETDSL